MRTCEEYRTLISALIDDEISEEERTALMAHIDGCGNCKAYFDDQYLIHEAVQAMACTAPVGFADGVMARVRETKQEAPEKKVISFPHWKRFAGLAACCAVIALGVITMNGTNLSMEATSNSAAPEMAYGLTGAAQTAEDASADGAAPEMPETGLNENAANAPEQKTAAGAETPQTQSEEDGGAYAADSSEPYSEYEAVTEFSARIVTSSETAAQWVEEMLGEEWICGTCYLLTAGEYTDLCQLLEDRGEAFSIITGSEETELYQLLAE